MILDRKHALQQKLFREFAETEFTKELQDELDETGEFNWDMHKKMSRYGFMGVKIPEEYGGAGSDSLTYVLMDEEFARQDAVLAIYANTSNSLGGGPLLLAGSESQKKEYLPQVASGEKILVFGLTEPGAGSDAGGTTTTAIPDGEDFIINGRKCFIRCTDGRLDYHLCQDRSLAEGFPRYIYVHSRHARRGCFAGSTGEKDGN